MGPEQAWVYVGELTWTQAAHVLRPVPSSDSGRITPAPYNPRTIQMEGLGHNQPDPRLCGCQGFKSR